MSQGQMKRTPDSGATPGWEQKMKDHSKMPPPWGDDLLGKLKKAGKGKDSEEDQDEDQDQEEEQLDEQLILCPICAQEDCSWTRRVKVSRKTGERK